MSFCYPATEGERSYIRGSGGGRGAAAGKRWVERFHPVKSGAKQACKIMIGLSVEPDFSAAMRQTWRAAYEETPPAIAHTDIAACYEASIKLISDWSRDCFLVVQCYLGDLSVQVSSLYSRREI